MIGFKGLKGFKGIKGLFSFDPFDSFVPFDSSGFTLIELLVVVGMIGILLISLIATFNPLAQYNKAIDSTREHDLGQIQRALDTYFNDTKCYPQSLTFGNKWSSGSQVYMEKVPQDPGCSTDPNKCYVYETDTTSSCPQWDVLYASLRSSAIPSNACPLAVKSAGGTLCTPNNYASTGFNYCTISGNVDCSVVEGFSIPFSGGGGGSGGGGNGNPTVTPTPTGIVCNSGYSGCTGIDKSCNSIDSPSKCTQNGGSFAFCYCDKHCNQQCPGGN